MIHDNIEITKIRSADKSNLWVGIIAIALIVVLESVIVRHFFVGELSEAVFLLLFLQMPVCLLLMVTVTSIGAYKRMADFDIMYCNLDDADTKWIRTNYFICAIDADGVIFIDRENRQLYKDWSLSNKIGNTHDAFTILWAKGECA